MRREALYLTDIIEAVGSIDRFLTGATREAFLSDELLRSAVLHKLTIIGEAAARLPRPFRDAHPEIEWAEIVSFRNIAVHAYFAVDWAVVWTAATQDAPEVRHKVAVILSRHYPEVESA